jgi:hypothetical protein
MKVNMSAAAMVGAAIIGFGALFAAVPEASAKKSTICADLKNSVDLPDTMISISELLPAGANPAPVGSGFHLPGRRRDGAGHPI